MGQVRIWNLAYADDIVLVARNKEALEDMMDTMRKFFNARKLILSTEKTKVLVFNKQGNSKKENWIWEGKVIEEVKDFKYLGFTFSRDCSYKEHIKELKKKGIAAARIVWRLGKGCCKNDFRRRKLLFNYLVKSVMEYGVEIWGLEEKKELEKVQIDYYRWVLGLHISTPRYVIYTETGTEKLGINWGGRILMFVEKIREMNSSNRLVRICWEEKGKEKKGDLYSLEKEKYYNKLGYSNIAVEMEWNLGKKIPEEMVKRNKDIERQTILSKIAESRYNRRYKEIIGSETPEYLKGRKKMKNIGMVARLRCGNIEKVNRYWLEDKEKMCELCGKDWSSFNHMVEECEVTAEWRIDLPGQKYCYVFVYDHRT